MPASQRQQRKGDSKNSLSNSNKSKSTNNSNIWMIAIAFAALVFYVLYQSISVYSNERAYNDFD